MTLEQRCLTPGAGAVSPASSDFTRWPWLGAMLAGLAGAALGLTPRTPAPTGRIAVLPFAVHGGAGYEYLRDGMVDLLATSIAAWETCARSTRAR